MSGGPAGHGRTRRFVAFAAAFAAVVPAVGCGSSPTDPLAELSVTATSAHFVYHWSPGDEPPDSAYQERHLAWLTAGLGVEPSGPLEYFKYRDSEQLAELTGHTRGTGFAEDGGYRFHTIWAKDNHEYVHALITAEVGTPPALFNEGVAVAHHGASFSGELDGDPLWNGLPVRGQVRSLRDAGGVPSLNALLENGAFHGVDAGVSYPVAGSFVRYLIDVYGPDRLVSLLASCPRDASASTVRATVLEAYDMEIDTLWAEWLAWL